MIIGDRIRGMREEKNLSQGDIEKRIGLLRRCISRVENSHPAIETLEKIEARYLKKLRRLLSKSDETDRKLLPQEAQKIALRHPRASSLPFGYPRSSTLARS